MEFTEFKIKERYLNIIKNSEFKTILKYRILANRPMIRINNRVYYLSTGTSMNTAGPVVGLFENTWMGVGGVARDEPNRKINKRGNDNLVTYDVKEEKEDFDGAVIDTLKPILPNFNETELYNFYDELQTITNTKKINDTWKINWDQDPEILVRQGVWSTFGKIAADDLLLSGALSNNSEFFKITTVGKKIREKGIEKYGNINVEPDTENPIVNYPLNDPDFDHLTENDLKNYSLYSFIELGNIVIQKFLISENLKYDSKFEKYKSFIGYVCYILDKKIVPGTGYGTCYKILEEILKKKIENKKQYLKKKSRVMVKNFVATITFGEVAENHVGMEKLGMMKNKGEGISFRDLKRAKKIFKEKGYKVKIYDLVEEGEVKDLDPEPAYVMVIRNGVSAFLNEDNQKDNSEKKDNVNELNSEILGYEWDKKAFMRGRVVNKLARYNLNYADFDQEPDYSEKKGRVVDFKRVPMLSEIRKNIPEFLGSKVDHLFAEGNFYYDLNQCGIGFHGDAERRIVIAIRLGDSSIPIHYNWFQRGVPVGKRIILNLNPGDVYIMSEKAVGTDWMKKIVPTLRHATGCKKYTEIKEKKK